MFKDFYLQLKKYLQYFVVFQFYLKRNTAANNFSSLLKESKDILVIMPDNDVDTNSALEFADKLIPLGKKITLLERDKRISLIQSRRKIPMIEYGIIHFNKIGLPTRELILKLKEKKFDVVIDLNTTENLFLSLLANLANAKYKIGFSREKSEDFYNMILINNERNPALSYRNLLNSLKMF
ncbi:MAG: hypothetical protein WCJ01_07815 [Ignavibacteria bacterium]